MHETDTIDRSGLITLIKEYGGVDSYTTTQAATILKEIFRLTAGLGLTPESREGFAEGVRRIFRFEFLNRENYEQGKHVFVPNHVSEFDGLLFGTLIPNMLVVAKSDWGANPHLNAFLEKLFPIACVKRKDNASGLHVLRSCIEHLSSGEDRALTVFVQQTIADIAITKREDIATGVYHIARKTGARLIPVYCEQVSVEVPTRIVFGSPISCEDKDAFGEAWLKSELALRASLIDPPARPPVLCEKHQKPISEREFQA
ncbi:MAG: 1-acyl-sn-glycerol-3-phosphate acyltransferase [Lachnospiraceae bacterium]|nr:1-acyl-sn-glycerol-3-phosphate acyltransferase [Lachnospiraceae bacterium]